MSLQTSSIQPVQGNPTTTSGQAPTTALVQLITTLTNPAIPTTSLVPPALNQTGTETNSTANGTAPATGSTTYSGGVVAGVAVACIVGTAILAALITWLFMNNRVKSVRRKAVASSAYADRRNGRGVNGNDGEEMTTLVAGGKSVNGANRKSVGSASTATAATVAVAAPNAGFLKAILPANPDDDEVKSRVFAVLDGASIHVDNFYRNKATSDPTASPTTADLDGFNSPFLPQPVAYLVHSCGNPTVIIARALTELIVNAINPAAAASGLSLLPGDLGPLLAESQRFEQESGISGRRKEAESNAYWWRLLTMHLHARAAAPDSSSPTNTAMPGSGGPSLPLSSSQHGAALALAGTFQRTFRPWLRTAGAAAAGGGTGGQMAEEEDAALVGLLEAAAALGVWLHSQRSSFEFRWGLRAAQQQQLDQKQPAEIETAPVLLKVTDHNGARLSRPKVVLEPVVGRLSGGGGR